jgi:hypothetical protein
LQVWRVTQLGSREKRHPDNDLPQDSYSECRGSPKSRGKLRCNHSYAHAISRKQRFQLSSRLPLVDLVCSTSNSAVRQLTSFSRFFAAAFFPPSHACSSSVIFLGNLLDFESTLAGLLVLIVLSLINNFLSLLQVSARITLYLQTNLCLIKTIHFPLPDEDVF